MQPNGIIYDSRWQKPSGEIVLGLTRTTRIAYGFLRGVGSGLLVLGVAGIILALYPIVSSELSYRFSDHPTLQAIDNGFGGILLRAEANEKERAQRLAQQFEITNTQFSIYIPKINAKASIVGNVNPSDEEEYNTALKQGVAHAAGTSLPGMSGGSYLFAHSTDGAWNIAQYNAVFYLLRELQVEDRDEIYIFFLDKVYKYRVSEKHIVDANDVSWLTGSKEGPGRLILQTCWPPGTAWKRLLIVAQLEQTTQ